METSCATAAGRRLVDTVDRLADFAERLGRELHQFHGSGKSLEQPCRGDLSRSSRREIAEPAASSDGLRCRRFHQHEEVCCVVEQTHPLPDEYPVRRGDGGCRCGAVAVTLTSSKVRVSEAIDQNATCRIATPITALAAGWRRPRPTVERCAARSTTALSGRTISAIPTAMSSN